MSSLAPSSKQTRETITSGSGSLTPPGVIQITLMQGLRLGTPSSRSASLGSWAAKKVTERTIARNNRQVSAVRWVEGAHVQVRNSVALRDCPARFRRHRAGGVSSVAGERDLFQCRRDGPVHRVDLACGRAAHLLPPFNFYLSL